jgi:tRNA/tmRNA/rRNA uracil-C5-methylase (TrmA/RlmC/RlmD family)
MEWGEHHRCLFYGAERFFRRGYNANLVSSWLPALDGVIEKLTAGGRGADVGCGHGASTILMAQAFPNSQFVGIDYHGASIETARERAAKVGVDNASFELADATRPTAAMTMTSSGSSTACTIWPTRPAWLGMRELH